MDRRINEQIDRVSCVFHVGAVCVSTGQPWQLSYSCSAMLHFFQNFVTNHLGANNKKQHTTFGQTLLSLLTRVVSGQNFPQPFPFL